MRPTRRGSGEEKHWFTLFHPYYSPLTPNKQPGYYFCICMTFSHFNLALWGLDLKSLILKVSKHTGVCVRTLWVFISRNRDDCNLSQWKCELSPCVSTCSSSVILCQTTEGCDFIQTLFISWTAPKTNACKIFLYRSSVFIFFSAPGYYFVFIASKVSYLESHVWARTNSFLIEFKCAVSG